MTILSNTENFWDGFDSNFSTVDIKQYAVFLLIPVLAPIFLILLWLVLASRIDNQVILPGVWEVGTLLFHPTQDMIGMGSLAGNVLVSLVRVVMGYSIAAAIAVPLGVVMGYYGLVFRFFNGFLSLFRPIPPWPGFLWSWPGSALQAWPPSSGLKQARVLST